MAAAANAVARPLRSPIHEGCPRGKPASLEWLSVQHLTGKLLIASARLVDPNFAQSVVLIVQHEENGALGLILNRPLETTIQQACEQALEMTCTIDDVLHQGGPCEGPLMVLHDQPAEGQVEVLPGVYFTTDKSEIESLLTRPDADTRFFVGYAGWAPGQLEAEMETGSWLTADPTRDHVFSDAEKLWQNLMAKLTVGRWIDPNRMPDDPSVN